MLIGLPVGLRVQHQLAGRLWWEVGGSLYIVVPAFFGGLRMDFQTITEKADSFHIRPGLGVGITGAHTFDDWDRGKTVFWATGDVDFVWRHRWGGEMFGEFGFKLGLVAPTNVRNPIVMPRAALIFGIQF